MAFQNTIEIQPGQHVSSQPFPERRPLFWALGSDGDAESLVALASRNCGGPADPCRVVWVHDSNAVDGLFPGLPNPPQLRGFTTSFDGAVRTTFLRSAPVPDDLDVLTAITNAVGDR